MKNLFLLSLLLFPNLDSVFLTTRESSSTPPNWDYLPVLRRFMEEDDLCYGRQKTVFSLDGEDYLYTQVLHEGEYEGYVLSKDDEFVQACLTEKDPVSDYDARYYFDGFLFLDEAKPRSMPEHLDVTASGTLGRKGVARRAEEPFYPEHYPSVSSSVTYYSWTDTGSDYSQFYWLNDVPEYYWSYGCSPTAAAMLTSFLDRYCSDFSGLYDGLLPLKTPIPEDFSDPYPNDVRVQAAISELAQIFQTDSEGVTLSTRIPGGLENLFRERGIDDYYVKVSNNFVFYSNLIKKCRLPVLMGIKTDQTSFIMDHTVLSYGIVYRPSQSVPDIIAHSTWASHPGNYFFSCSDAWEFYYVTNVGY